MIVTAKLMIWRADSWMRSFVCYTIYTLSYYTLSRQVFRKTGTQRERERERESWKCGSGTLEKCALTSLNFEPSFLAIETLSNLILKSKRLLWMLEALISQLSYVTFGHWKDVRTLFHRWRHKKISDYNVPDARHREFNWLIASLIDFSQENAPQHSKRKKSTLSVLERERVRRSNAKFLSDQKLPPTILLPKKQVSLFECFSRSSAKRLKADGTYMVLTF
jgi:hypothetical protein